MNADAHIEHGSWHASPADLLSERESFHRLGASVRDAATRLLQLSILPGPVPPGQVRSIAAELQELWSSIEATFLHPTDLIGTVATDRLELQSSLFSVSVLSDVTAFLADALMAPGRHANAECVLYCLQLASYGVAEQILDSL